MVTESSYASNGTESHSPHRNRLSDKPRAAGRTCVAVNIIRDMDDDTNINYSLGKRFERSTRRDLNSFVKRGTLGRNSYDERRSLISEWMRGVKVCFVCNENHMARDKHSI